MYLTIYLNRKYQLDPTTLNRTFEQTYANTKTIAYLKATETQKNNALQKEAQLTQFWNNLPDEIKNLALNECSMQPYYYTFRIPKKTKGFREINAPIDSLKELQTNITKLFQKTLQIAPHNAAYAYVQNRSSLDALKQHQKNDSNWFLKLDIKDFFPSCTKELVYDELCLIYPCAEFTETGKQILKYIIHLCCLNGVLPQGSPASPYLSNVLFTKYDFKITNYLKTIGKYVYTRYADDILISARTSFDWQQIIKDINIIFVSNFIIKDEKTRYGSKAGRNWNLGVMLNKDNKLTIGHVNNQNLKAQLHHFIMAYKDGHPYSIPETQHLQGVLNYAKQIEPDYIDYIIKHYSRKFNCNILEAIKYCLKIR